MPQFTDPRTLDPLRRRREANEARRSAFDARAHELTLADRPITCPAGEKVAEAMGGVACRCRISHTTVRSRLDPLSLGALCMGDYRGCAIWRTEKARIEEGLTAALVEPTDDD